MSIKEKLSGGTFKHIEGEMYHFHETKKELTRLKEDILHESHSRSNGRYVKDPTGEKAVHLVTHHRVQHMQKVVDVISHVYEELPDEKKRLVQLLYWKHPQVLKWEGIARKLYISKRTAQRWRKSIVEEVAYRLGWR